MWSARRGQQQGLDERMGGEGSWCVSFHGFADQRAGNLFLDRLPALDGAASAAMDAEVLREAHEAGERSAGKFHAVDVVAHDASRVPGMFTVSGTHVPASTVIVWYHTSPHGGRCG